MTQENKELLLKDLCGRLLYGVKCNINGDLCKIERIDIEHQQFYLKKDDEHGGTYSIARGDLIKPYLRPMSSMTEEEKEKLINKCLHTETEEDWEGMRSDVWGIEIFSKYDTRRWDNPIWPSTINMDAIDWLNAHYFDYRGLIPMGLALEAPEGMY